MLPSERADRCWVMRTTSVSITIIKYIAPKCIISTTQTKMLYNSSASLNPLENLDSSHGGNVLKHSRSTMVNRVAQSADRIWCLACCTRWGIVSVSMLKMDPLS